MINRGATLVSRLAVVMAILLSLAACGGGGGDDSFYDGESSGPVFHDGSSSGGSSSGGSSGGNTAQLSLGFSDSLPEDLKQVVIEVDTITLQSSELGDLVIDNFTIAELDLEDADTFQINLLNYRGTNQLLVIEELQLIEGVYDAVSIAILAEGVNQSYVQLEDDSLKPLEVSNGLQGLPGIQITSGTQIFTVEFGLAQALQYQLLTDRYLLTENGIRIENNQTAATLSGTVQTSLFDSVSPCSEKTDPIKGNRVYLYSGIGLPEENLADVFTTDSITPIPREAIMPFAVASMELNSFTGGWEYAFGYIPAGSYTIAFACDTAGDGSVSYNGLDIPLPTNQRYEITLSESQQGVCNLTQDAGC